MSNFKVLKGNKLFKSLYNVIGSILFFIITAWNFRSFKDHEGNTKQTVEGLKKIILTFQLGMYKVPPILFWRLLNGLGQGYI